MLPYTYSGFARCALEGYTMQRAMVMDYGTSSFAQIADQFMWGDNLLVAPILNQKDNNAKSREVLLPSSQSWINFWTGVKVNVSTSMSDANSNGDFTTLNAAAPIEASPLFVKSGTILPLGPLKQYVSEKPADPLEIRIYPGSDGIFRLYEDDGTSREYMMSNAYSTITFEWKDTERMLTISNVEGSFDGMLKTRTFEIVLVSENHGAGLAPEIKPERVLSYVGEQMIVKLSDRSIN